MRELAPLAGFDVAESPHLPAGTVLIIEPGAFQPSTHPLTLREDPAWPPAPPGFSAEAAAAWADAHRHLERSLDALCDHFGLDPVAAWRAPRAACGYRSSYAAYERAAFAVLPPRSFAAITNV